MRQLQEDAACIWNPSKRFYMPFLVANGTLSKQYAQYAQYHLQLLLFLVPSHLICYL